ncbi:MAG TPA: 4Fe-4S dicluster domain-containing protein, partial [Afipia sp.]
VPRISKKDNKAYKCTLCVDRVNVGQEPACVKTCPTGAIRFGTKERMTDYAAGRIEDLKSRGFSNAGLYDPAGVGGTHVMYVLQHADRPQLYSGLPDKPAISLVTRAWVSVVKPLGGLAIAATVAGFFAHLLAVGRAQVREIEHAPDSRRGGDAEE